MIHYKQIIRILVFVALNAKTPVAYAEDTTPQAIPNAQAKELIKEFSGKIDKEHNVAKLMGMIPRVCVEHLRVDADEKPTENHMMAFTIIDIDSKAVNCLKENKCNDPKSCVSLDELSHEDKDRFKTSIKIPNESLEQAKVGVRSAIKPKLQDRARLEAGVAECRCNAPPMPGPEDSVKRSFNPEEMKKALAKAQQPDDAKPKGPPPSSRDRDKPDDDDDSRLRRDRRKPPSDSDDSDRPKQNPMGMMGNMNNSQAMMAQQMAAMQAYQAMIFSGSSSMGGMGGMGGMSMGGMGGMSMGGMGGMSMGAGLGMSSLPMMGYSAMSMPRMTMPMMSMPLSNMSNMSMMSMPSMGLGFSAGISLGGLGFSASAGLSGYGIRPLYPSSSSSYYSPLGLNKGLNSYYRGY